MTIGGQYERSNIYKVSVPILRKRKATSRNEEHSLYRDQYRGRRQPKGSHGSCSWCEGNRTYTSQRSLERTRDEMDHWEEETVPGIGGLWEGWGETEND